MYFPHNSLYTYYRAAQAEVEANNLLVDLKKNFLSVDVADLTPTVHDALKWKLKYLPSKILSALHSNPSFNVVSTVSVKYYLSCDIVSLFNVSCSLLLFFTTSKFPNTTA